MSTKRSLLFLFAVILISIAFMSTIFTGDTRPAVSDDSDDSNSLDSSIFDVSSSEIMKELKIVVPMDSEEYKELLELSSQFEENHSDVFVEVEGITKEEAYEYYKEASRLGEVPDVMLLHNEWINEFAALGYLAEVDEILMSNIQDLQIAPMIEQVKWNGFLWAVPKDVDPYILVWNKNRLLEHELSPPKSIADLITIMQTTHQPDAGEYGLYFDFNDPFALLSLLWSIDVRWFDAAEQIAGLNNEITIQKLEDFLYHQPVIDEELQAGDGELEAPQKQKLSNNYLLPSEEFNPWLQMNEGKITMMITTLSEYRKHASEDIELAALSVINDPEREGELRGGWLHGRSFAVSSKSAFKPEAFEWIQSVNTTEAQLDLMNAGGGLPVMIAAYADRLKSMPHYEQIVAMIEHGGTLPAQPEQSEQLRKLQIEMNRLWNEELNIAQFVEQFDLIWNESEVVE